MMHQKREKELIFKMALKFPYQDLKSFGVQEKLISKVAIESYE
jgi:hypothetical protein